MIKKIFFVLVATVVPFNIYSKNNNIQQKQIHDSLLKDFSAQEVDILYQLLVQKTRKELACSGKVCSWLTLFVPLAVLTAGVLMHKKEFAAWVKGEKYEEIFEEE